jgi:hypothetical protein
MKIPGPSGVLEAALTTTADASDCFAVLCHPHPEYGGSMEDSVVGVLEAALLGAGVACVRFNFRGVGASEGRYDGGSGEQEDLIAVVDWLRDEHEPTHLWLGGYSFGASVVWHALDRIEPERALLVAPPTRVTQFEVLDPAVPVDTFSGSDDDYVDLQILERLPSVRSHVIHGADHFFSGHLLELERSISRTLIR